MQPQEKLSDRIVLLVISTGLILILLAIIAGVFGWFKTQVAAPLPNWAENVLVSIGTAAALKLGDCLSTLIALSTGRQVERLGTQLGQSAPLDTQPVPESAKQAADQVADAAVNRADEITDAAAVAQSFKDDRNA